MSINNTVLRKYQTEQLCYRVTPRQCLITYCLRLQLYNDRKLKPVGLYIAFPGSISLRQKLLSLHYSHKAGETTDDHGNRWLSVAVPSSSQEFVFTYRARVRILRTNYRWDSVIGKWPKSPSRFLLPEPGIESDNPLVLKLARQISATSPVEIVKQAFMLVRNTLSYRLQKKEYGAEYAARHREGDCTEYASLFAAILRACGIGARINIGYLGDEELHAITEVYMCGIWVPMDVTNNTKPLLGLSQDFITIMRANWMSHGAIEKLVSFYYQTAHNRTPAIYTTVHLKYEAQPKVIVLNAQDSGSQSLPYKILPDSSNIPLIGSIESKEKYYRVCIRNLGSWEISARLLVIGCNQVLAVNWFTIAADSQCIWYVASKDFKKYIERYETIKLMVLDSAEQGKIISFFKGNTSIKVFS